MFLGVTVESVGAVLPQKHLVPTEDINVKGNMVSRAEKKQIKFSFFLPLLSWRANPNNFLLFAEK